GTGTAANPATLNTNGNSVTVNASTLRTGATPDQTTPATLETGGGALIATGTAARRSVVDLGAGTTSNVGPVSLTLTDLTTGPPPNGWGGRSATAATVCLDQKATVTAGPLALTNSTMLLNLGALAKVTTVALTEASIGLSPTAALEASGTVSVAGSANGSST